MSRRFFTALAAAIGILMVAYGMIRDKDLVFVIGLVILVGVYIVIRREIKASLKDTSSQRPD
ncbi:MAG: hypothetical protein JRH06_00185 [Deltaproteobacteria bacterium]|nr:hypothetical protein [Deltaproteobacteria bacterium]MBW2135957.1 hypothetical protein [Deltaproteobacteria bacterium]